MRHFIEFVTRPLCRLLFWFIAEANAQKNTEPCRRPGDLYTKHHPLAGCPVDERSAEEMEWGEGRSQSDWL